MSQPTDKAGWRVWARRLPPLTRAENVAVLAHLADWLADLAPAGTVLTYLAMPGEIDLDPLTLTFRSLEWVTTRTPPSGPLTVHPYGSPREHHALGYAQPRSGSPSVDPAEIAVALVPGLCFDRCGQRLGRGKGYYDRLLAHTPAATRVGVTLDRRVVAELPFDDHDVVMQRLATESGCSWVSPCD